MSFGLKKRISPAVCEGILALHDIAYIREDSMKTVLFYTLSVLTFGIIYAVAINVPSVMRRLKYSLVESAPFATHFYVTNWDDTSVILPKEDIKTFDFDKNAGKSTIALHLS